MRHIHDQAQRSFHKVPKLVPAGSVNRVLLIGGKNLTMFQSVGLMFIGVCVAAGVGGLLFVAEFGFEAKSGDHTYAIYLLLAGSALVLWGLVMFINGLRGVVRRIWRRK
jgi:type IV secretory pathway TrbL component